MNILIIIFLFAIRGAKILVSPRAPKISGPALLPRTASHPFDDDDITTEPAADGAGYA
jgi:hypothetical protein